MVDKRLIFVGIFVMLFLISSMGMISAVEFSQQLNGAGKDTYIKSAEPSKSAEPASTGYTMERVKANGTSSSCWTVINGYVYDLTKWIGSHPGGSGAITSLCGTDGTSEFLAMHRGQGKPEARLSGYALGKLEK